MGYILQFLLGGTIMVCASLLSKSKYLFLSGIITLLPIMTLVNIHLQMKNMNIMNFRITQKNAIFGSFGAVILISVIFILTHWIKPTYAVIGAFIIYILYMLGCKYFLSQQKLHPYNFLSLFYRHLEVVKYNLKCLVTNSSFSCFYSPHLCSAHRFIF